MTRRARLLTAVVATTLALGACSDDGSGSPAPDPSAPREPLTQAQVDDAVLTLEDLPASLVPSRFTVTDPDRSAFIDRLLTGAAECAFLFTGELPDPAPVGRAEAAFTFGSIGTIVASAVRTYAAGDAQEAVDLAYVEAQGCRTFRVDMGGGAVAEASVVNRVTDDAGDQTVTTVVEYLVDGTLFLEQTRTVVRLGGDVAIVELVLFEPTADRVHDELVRAAVNQLEDVRREAA